jgi:hypothetical protein
LLLLFPPPSPFPAAVGSVAAVARCFSLSTLWTIHDEIHGGTLVGENTRDVSLAGREFRGWAGKFP